MNHNWSRFAALVALAAIIPACGGSSGGGSGGGPAVPSFVIAGPGGLTLVTQGGATTNGSGGGGGTIRIQGRSGSGVHSQTGALSVDTSFSIPAFAVNLGANPRNITANTILTPPGTNGLIPGSAAGNATGLHVSNGATLTINADTGGGGTSAHLSFPNGVLVDAGCTLLMNLVGGSNDAVDLTVTSSVFVLSPGSFFLAVGTTGGAPASGGDGGSLMVTCAGDILVQGTINTSGGGTSVATGIGGDGGLVILTTSTACYSTATIATNGGSATVAALGGGAGGNVKLGGSGVGVFSSGSISAKGGSGGFGGGSGGKVQLGLGQTVGAVISSGNIDTRGGDGTSANANGGAGGAIELLNSGDQLRATGSWTSAGGEALVLSGIGGDGGAVTVMQDNPLGASFYIASPLGTGGVAFSAAVDASGGDGKGQGSAGGDITIGQDLDGIDATLAGTNPVYVVGYDLYVASGGLGSATGGWSGRVRIHNELFTSGTPGVTFHGSAENSVDAVLNGGAGGSAEGGAGGFLQVYGGVSAENSGNVSAPGGNGDLGGAAGGLIVANRNLLDLSLVLPDPGAWVANSGAVVGNGGAGAGGNGGIAAQLFVVGHAQGTNSGSVTSNGGAAGGAGGGGFGAQVSLVADGTFSNTGGVTSFGGAAPGGQGGGGGLVRVNAQEASHVGSISLMGGNGLTSGGGGLAVFNSQFGGTVLHGTFTLIPGTGQNPKVGTLVKDGLDLPLLGGAATY